MPLESLAQAMNRISAEVRGGPLSGLRMAEGGAVYDPMGNVSIPPSEGFAPSPTYENIADALARAGATAGRPTVGALETAARVYSEKSREAAAENEALRQQAMRNMQGELGYAGMPLGAGQMLLSQLGTATLPLTAAAKTAGHAATQATGNPRFGENVEMLSGFVDPSHVGMLKAVAPTAGAAAARQAVQTARELSPLGLYSHGAEAALAMPQAKGSPEQMLAYLQNRAGVKPGELESARAAFAERPHVTREEIAQHLREQMPVVEEKVLRETAPQYPYTKRDQWFDAIEAAERRGDEAEVNRLNNAWQDQRDGIQPEGAPKYQQYTLPGGENYREVLLKVPDSGDLNARPMFVSNHWDDPNVLAHIRMADRTGPNGEKILHVEELQSDWGQAGRKEGFQGPNFAKWRAARDKLGAEWKKSTEEYKTLAKEIEPPVDFKFEAGKMSPREYERQLDALESAREKRIQEDPRMQELDRRRNGLAIEFGKLGLAPSDKGVARGPYVTSTEGWTDLALKRVMKEAAEGGYDRVVFTPGAEQAKRYDLANHVERVAYDPEEKALSFVKKGGRGWQNYEGAVEPGQLAGIIGKDAAERLLATEPSKLSGIHNLETEGLTFGGEGMQAYYDKMVPKRLQELARRHDKSAKVEQQAIPIARGKPTQYGSFDEWSAAPETAEIPMSGITITPQMRESILRGQPHMADGGEVNFDPMGNVTIPPAESFEPSSVYESIADTAARGPVRRASGGAVPDGSGDRAGAGGAGRAGKEQLLKLMAEHGLHRPQIAAILRENDPRLSPVQATARAREITTGDTEALRGILSDKLMADLRRMLKGARP